MTKRTAFSADEWQILVFTPLVIFYAVAHADGSVSRLETSRLTATIDNGTKLTQENTELAREVFTSLKGEFDQSLKSLESALSRGETFDEMLAAARTVLDGQVPQAEALVFKQIMVLTAANIAEAGPLFGSKVTDAERASVERIRESLGAP
jgi:tellurite resistance protein